MPSILGAPTGDIYDSRRVSVDSLGALILDKKIVNDSWEAWARIIPSWTYRLGSQLRGNKQEKLDDFLAEMFQTIFISKYKVLEALKKIHPEVFPIINLHGVGTEPYRWPHQTVWQIQEYHGSMIEQCLNHAFPHTRPPLLYELIPTIEEACSIAHLCRENNWRVVISLYVKKNPEWHLCIQNAQGRLIPLEDGMHQIEDVADKENCWYSFNCFDPRLVEELIRLLRASRLWHRVRGMYPNLADAENDPEFTPLWHEGIEQHLVSWNPPEEGMPAFIGACCGSTPEHIRRLHLLLHTQSWDSTSTS